MNGQTSKMSSLHQKKERNSYKRMYGYKQTRLIINCLPSPKSRRGYERFDMLQRRFNHLALEMDI